MSLRPQELYAADFVTLDDDTEGRILALLALVHGLNRAAPAPFLGIDFPAWQAGMAHAPRNALRHLRVFAAEQDLEQFLAHPSVRRVSTLVLRVTAPRPCENPRAWARLGRDNYSDKCKPAYWRRKAKATQREASRPQEPRLPGLQLSMRSQSTRQEFGLRIRKVVAEQRPERIAFNSYGLCKEGAIPQL